GLLDVPAGQWSERLCALAGVDDALLPPLVPAGETVGRVHAEAASRTGIPEGTPVVLGGGDTHAGLVGLGALEPGALGVVAGSTMPVMAVAAARAEDPDGRCWLSAHPAGGRWVVEANTGEAGTALDWMADLFGVSVSRLGALSAAAPAGAGGTRAVLGPAPVDWSNFPILRRGVLSLPLPASHTGIGRAEVARALVDNLAISVRLARDWVAGVVPVPGPARIGGRLARLRSFPEAVADALGAPVLVASDPDVTLRGAAAAAAVAAGWHPTLDGAAAAIDTRLRTVEPTHAELYEQLVKEWAAEVDGLGWVGLSALLPG
ncbi:MAG TPA: FGGY family carbohydrate kinase, partial [Acidimicrobiales bacterium]|nr:FGGY family carbohydrate kinase [Acidimicrobiales bacterium]